MHKFWPADQRSPPLKAKDELGLRHFCALIHDFDGFRFVVSESQCEVMGLLFLLSVF